MFWTFPQGIAGICSVPRAGSGGQGRAEQLRTDPDFPPSRFLLAPDPDFLPLPAGGTLLSAIPHRQRQKPKKSKKRLLCSPCSSCSAGHKPSCKSRFPPGFFFPIFSLCLILPDHPQSPLEPGLELKSGFWSSPCSSQQLPGKRFPLGLSREAGSGEAEPTRIELGLSSD